MDETGSAITVKAKAMKRMLRPVRRPLRSTGPSLGRRRDRRPAFPAHPALRIFQTGPLRALEARFSPFGTKKGPALGGPSPAAPSHAPLGVGGRAAISRKESVARDDVLLERLHRTLVLVLRRNQVPDAEDQRQQDRDWRVVDRRGIESRVPRQADRL